MSTVPELYHAVRGAEGRILGDAIVAGLPESGPHTPHAREWRIRARSLKRVLEALTDTPRRVLEVGCGNGWFSARLAQGGHTVTGLDNGLAELDQARRVFARLPITWVKGDPWDASLPMGSFDLILFAASIQYFPDLHALVKRCRELLKDGGEVLIVDSHFYGSKAAAEQARLRSAAHYASIGTPEMAAFYHHHTRQAITESATEGTVVIIPPRGKVAALLLGRYPFPIVRIHP
jgi:SAM-dependent methyltransferase